MSGHSKWATIKHKKAALDAKRVKLFAKLYRTLEVAARAGGADPGSDAALRTVAWAGLGRGGALSICWGRDGSGVRESLCPVLPRQVRRVAVAKSTPDPFGPTRTSAR